MLLALPKTPTSLPLVIFHTGRSIELFFLLDHGPGHHMGEEHRAILSHGSLVQPLHGRGALGYSFFWIMAPATIWERSTGLFFPLDHSPGHHMGGVGVGGNIIENLSCALPGNSQRADILQASIHNVILLADIHQTSIHNMILLVATAEANVQLL